MSYGENTRTFAQRLLWQLAVNYRELTLSYSLPMTAGQFGRSLECCEQTSDKILRREFCQPKRPPSDTDQRTLRTSHARWLAWKCYLARMGTLHHGEIPDRRAETAGAIQFSARQRAVRRPGWPRPNPLRSHQALRSPLPGPAELGPMARIRRRDTPSKSSARKESPRRQFRLLPFEPRLL